jgi:hypothetical protein
LTEEFNKEKETAIIPKMATADYPISEIISRRWIAKAFSTFINFGSSQMGFIFTK